MDQAFLVMHREIVSLTQGSSTLSVCFLLLWDEFLSLMTLLSYDCPIPRKYAKHKQQWNVLQFSMELNIKLQCD